MKSRIALCLLLLPLLVACHRGGAKDHSTEVPLPSSTEVTSEEVTKGPPSVMTEASLPLTTEGSLPEFSSSENPSDEESPSSSQETDTSPVTTISETEDPLLQPKAFLDAVRLAMEKKDSIFIDLRTGYKMESSEESYEGQGHVSFSYSRMTKTGHTKGVESFKGPSSKREETLDSYYYMTDSRGSGRIFRRREFGGWTSSLLPRVEQDVFSLPEDALTESQGGEAVISREGESYVLKLKADLYAVEKFLYFFNYGDLDVGGQFYTSSSLPPYALLTLWVDGSTLLPKKAILDFLPYANEALAQAKVQEKSAEYTAIEMKYSYELKTLPYLPEACRRIYEAEFPKAPPIPTPAQTTEKDKIPDSGKILFLDGKAIPFPSKSFPSFLAYGDPYKGLLEKTLMPGESMEISLIRKKALLDEGYNVKIRLVVKNTDAEAVTCDKATVTEIEVTALPGKDGIWKNFNGISLRGGIHIGSPIGKAEGVFGLPTGSSTPGSEDEPLGSYVWQWKGEKGSTELSISTRTGEEEVIRRFALRYHPAETETASSAE